MTVVVILFSSCKHKSHMSLCTSNERLDWCNLAAMMKVLKHTWNYINYQITSFVSLYFNSSMIFSFLKIWAKNHSPWWLTGNICLLFPQPCLLHSKLWHPDQDHPGIQQHLGAYQERSGEDQTRQDWSSLMQGAPPLQKGRATQAMAWGHRTEASPGTTRPDVRRFVTCRRGDKCWLYILTSY